jgi:hypothetical protein
MTLAMAVPAAFATPPCAGDCGGNGRVSVDELVLGIGVALGDVAMASCSPADLDGNDTVSVDELIGAVNNALLGCPSFSGVYSATVALVEGQSASLEFAFDGDGTIDGTLIISPPEAVPGAGRGAGGVSVAITGNVDLDSGEFSLHGSYLDDGVIIAIQLSGTLPGHPGANKPFMLSIGSFVYTGQLTAGPIQTPTPTPTPTVTPTPETIGGLSVRMIGTFSGTALIEVTGGEQAARLKIEVIGGQVFVTDLTQFILGTFPIQMTVDSPTMISLHQTVPSILDFTLSLTPEGGIEGLYKVTNPGMPGGSITFDLMPES